MVAWLPETTKDPFLDENQQPAPLFRVLYRDSRVGDEDLELHEVNASLQKELKRSADAAGPPAKRPTLKLLREWEWAEVPPGEISPTFRELYKEHVGDRYGDADGSSRGRTVATPLFGDPNALV